MSYKTLEAYKNTEVIYDFTMEFCKRYVDYKSRTKDQMEQAGRSGKQNIAEGSSQRDSQGELKLTKISRGSLEELLKDYEDFLRQRGLKQWSQDNPRAQEIRSLAYRSNKSYTTYRAYMDSPERAGNAMICLINQTNYLLDQLIRSLEKQSLQGAGQRDEQIKRAWVKKRQAEDAWIAEQRRKLKEQGKK